MIRPSLLWGMCRPLGRQFCLIHKRCSAVMLRNCTITHIPPQRGLITLTHRQTFRPQYTKDNVDKTYDLVYENALKQILGPTRLLSTVAGLVSAGGSVYALMAYSNMIQGWDMFALLSVFGISVISVGVFNCIARYYLTRIYFNASKNNFVAVYHTLFGRVKQIRYSKSDIKPVPSSGANEKIHLKSNVIIRDKMVHLKGSDFVLPKYYNMHIQL